MNLEEYKKEMSDIISQKQQLELRRKDVRRKYIQANKRFSIGAKVSLFKDGEFLRNAYVESVYINANNRLGYDLLKCKKDGEISKHRDCPPFGCEIRKCIE